MRAATYRGNREVRVEEIPEPELEADQVMIDIAACGICGSDLHEYTEGPRAVPVDEPGPHTIGHEFGGEVIETGSAVEHLSAGDVVAVNPRDPCRACRYCREGVYTLCTAADALGYAGRRGGFAERLAVNADRAVRLPGELDPTLAALIEPFAVGLHAVRITELDPGDPVAVYGTGPIGLTVVQAARAAGANPIYAVEPQETRRGIAAETGADVTIDPGVMDPANAISDHTDGGADVAFEVAGLEETVRQAAASTKRGGHVTVVSLFHDEIAWNPHQLVGHQRSMLGSCACDCGPGGGVEFNVLPGMFADDTLDAEALVSSRIPLEDITVNGFEALLDEERDEVKILVEP